MSAYVPGFQYDLFVSYAHIDNLPAIADDDKSGWVHSLIQKLDVSLAQKLGVKGAIWMDPRLAGNEPVTPALLESIARCANLLIVLSEGYLQSEWCALERQKFIEAAGGDPGKRLFVIQLDEIPRERWPAELQDLIGFQFYEKEREEAAPKRLGWPMATSTDREYFNQLNDLSHKLKKQLKELRSRSDKEQTPPPTPHGEERPPTVFLAETSADLRRSCDNLRRQLQQSGVEVLPKKNYRRDPDSFRQAMELELAGSHLFVQLLGPYTTLKTEELPKGYEGLQLDVAETAQIPVMRWHDPDLELEQVEDRELLERAEIILLPFEEFKREVESTVRKLAMRKPAPVVEGDALALINADSGDRPLAKDFCNVLFQSGIGYDTVDPGVELQDQADGDYDALVVVAGSGGPEWTTRQIRQCNKVYRRNKPTPPVCAAYLSPAMPAEELGIRPTYFHFFSAPEEEGYREFVEAIKQRVTAE